MTSENDDPNTLFADGFEDALVGLARRCHQLVTVYSYTMCVEILMERDGLTHEEAIEYMEFNVMGAYVGDYTPVFLIDPQIHETGGDEDA